MLRSKAPRLDPAAIVPGLLVVAVLAAIALLLGASPAAANGGVGMPGASDDGDGRVERARLAPNGRAIAPDGAPARVKRAIRAANQIRRKPYKYGGGHGRWNDSGYDCSGAISYALRAARMIDSPLNSSGYMRWGRRGKGKWITVYANGGHAYAVIAGLRWDTSGTGGKGPRWHRDKRSPRGFKARHFRGF